MGYNPEIFRAYDIRGIYSRDFDTKFAFAIGNKLASGKIVVAYDNRPTSAEIVKQVIAGAIQAGAQVVSIGETTTPIFYFAVNHLSADGGIVVTASHNPPEYNGFKIVGPKAAPIDGQELKRLFESSRVKIIAGGSETNLSMIDEYLTKVWAVSGETAPSTDNFAFDQDYDRIFFQENGQLIPADLLFALLVERLGFKKVVYDLRFSKAVAERLTELGVVATRSKVGYPNFYQTMAANAADFGGELSGHFYFKSFAYREAPELVAAYVHKIVRESGQSLSELVKPYQKYFRGEEINIAINGGEPVTKVLGLVKQKYRDAKIDEFDGLTVEYPDWWFNLRPSNTEPVWRLVVEAKTKNLLEEKVGELSSLLKPAQS